MKKHKNRQWLCAVIFIIFCNIIFLSSTALSAGEKQKEAPVELSAEEKIFIKEKKKITIGCPTGNCPLLFEDEKTGEIKGITIDILDMVSDATGLEFQYQALSPGNITYTDLKQLQVDLVASVESNAINEQSLGIVMTEPYLQAEKVFVCKKGILFDPENHMVIAIASGSQTLASIIQEKYPKFQVTFYDSTEEALSALLSGKADAVLQNQYSIERILAKPLYEDLQIVAAASVGDTQCLACLVPISEDRQNVITSETDLLLSILNKGITSLNKSEVSFVIIKETAENTYNFTIEDMLYRYRYAMIIIMISLLLIIILLWRNHILQKKRSEQLAAETRARELFAINEHMCEQQILLQDALKRAEEGNRAKTSFLFNMSHDIRTPMNAILGFATIAYNNKDNEDKLNDSLEKIQKSGNHLLQLINDILDMSKIESGKVTLSENACNLIESIEKVRDILQTDIDIKNLTFEVNVSEVKNELVYCDNLRINQILFNLFSNAIKFSKPGDAITITLHQDPSDMKEYASYELHVKDTGIGMSKEFLTHIFEPFERERTSTISKTQGTGLGMSITKNLVDLMGGTIEVQSELDKGTEFILHFTFKIQEDVPQGEELTADNGLPVRDFSGKRLLLVEDNELNREIAEEILGEKGFIIETAEDGHIAVEMVRNSIPGYYDAILMDIQMPVMDGYQATREIRKSENKELAGIPIIAMTANAFDEDKKEALASGMNAHIAKPLDIGILLETLERILL